MTITEIPRFGVRGGCQHRQLKRFGTFIEPSWTSGESIVDFDDPDYPDDEDCLRITTAQLVAADEIGETA